MLKPNEGQKGSMGLDDQMGGMLSYLSITGLIFMFVEKDSQYIRFHSFQAVFLGLALIILNTILGFVPILGWMISLLLSPLTIILTIFMMYKTYQGQTIKLPIIGDLAESQVNK